MHFSQNIILANGEFPKHQIPLNLLTNAKRIICCDGAIDKLIKIGLKPTTIIGDLDSISTKSKTEYEKSIIHISRQSDSDLDKAIKFCINEKINNVTILGATGLREDHTIRNLFSLSQYVDKINMQLLTDTGIFTPINKPTQFESYAGQQVSVFGNNPNTLFSTIHLKYNLTNTPCTDLYSYALNESLSDTFHINMSGEFLLIFQTY
jgi:thiamine pyrophosphokinase